MPKISELAALAAPTDNDLVPIVDSAAAPDETKKTTWAQIKTALLAQLSVATAVANGLMSSGDYDLLQDENLSVVVDEEFTAPVRHFAESLDAGATFTRVTDEAGAIGVYQAALNATGGAAVTLYTAGAHGTVGDGELRVWGRFRALNLPDAIDNFIYGIGIGSSASFGATHGAWILFDRSVSALNWLARTRNGGVATTQDTGVVAVTAHKRFEVIINADRTSVAFKIGGTTVATLATNIPPGATTLYVFFRVERVAGTTNRQVSVDKLGFKRTFATSRGA